MDRIAVVGASLAGLRAAEALRREGFGGELTIVGAESHQPYNRPPLSKQLLAGTMEAAGCTFRQADIEARWLLGVTATGLDLDRREVALAGRDPLPFDGLVIATGSSARPWPGVALPEAAANVLSLRSLDEGLALREAALAAERVVVLGAGFIGCEVAATLRGLGREVALVDVAPRPMAPLGPELGELCARLHAEHGVALHLGETVTAWVGDGDRVSAVRLAEGAELPADLVLIATGAQPNTGWLRDAGLTLEPGVVCDATCRALGAEHVVAAGDVAAFPHPLAGGELVRIEHWSNAAEMGAAAAASLLGAETPYEPVPSFWSDQYDVKIQSVGLPAHADRHEVVEGSLAERPFVMAFARGDRLVGAIGFGAARRMPFYRRQIAEGRAPSELSAA